MIDPDLINDTVRAFLSSRADYATNSLVATYPRGLDVEVFTFEALACAWRSATQPYQRTHVTPYLYENPGMFKIVSLTADRNYSHYRWTLDTPEDLAMIRRSTGISTSVGTSAGRTYCGLWRRGRNYPPSIPTFGRRLLAKAETTMPVFRINNYLDGYRLRAQSEDVHEMSGRSGKHVSRNLLIIEFWIPYNRGRTTFS